MSAALPLHLERIGAELTAAAAARTAPVPQRVSRRRRLTLLATAVTLAATGTALAITKTNPLDWFRGGDPAREGRFTADPTRRVVGEFPSQIACRGGEDDLTCRGIAPPYVCQTTTQASGLEITGCASGRGTVCREVTGPDASVSLACSAGKAPSEPRRSGERSYSLFNRIEERPTIDIALVRRVLTPRRAVVLFPGADIPPPLRGVTGGDVIDLAERRTPEFWRALNLVIANQGGRISSGERPGEDLVPPAGVSRFATCDPPLAASLRCAAIVNGASLPIGAPVYSLDRDDDWIAVPTPSSEQRGAEYQAIWRAMLGRDLTDEESIVVTGLFALPAQPSGATPAAPPPVEGSETVPTP